MEKEETQNKEDLKLKNENSELNIDKEATEGTEHKDEDDQLVKVTEYDFLGHVIASIVYTDPITRVTDAYHTTDDGRSTEVIAVESVENFILDEGQLNSGIWRVVSGVFYDTDAQIIKRSEFDSLGAGSLTDYFINDGGQSCVKTISFDDWDTAIETVEQCL